MILYHSKRTCLQNMAIFSTNYSPKFVKFAKCDQICQSLARCLPNRCQIVRSLARLDLLVVTLGGREEEGAHLLLEGRPNLADRRAGLSFLIMKIHENTFLSLKKRTFEFCALRKR